MQTDGVDPDMHHRAFFPFEPTLFLADLGNIALDYSISGIHQLERAILESPLFQQPADSSLAPNCPAVQQRINEQLLQFKAAASEVLAEVQRRTADSMNRAADNFERYEAATNLNVPPELYVQQPIPSVPDPVDPEQEAQLDGELAELRQQVQQVHAKCRQLKQQLLHVDRDLSKAVLRAAAFKPLTEVVSANSQPLLDEAAAIGALASKLQPMVARAQQLQQERDHPVAAALAAAAASSAAAPSTTQGRRRTGGKAGAAVAAGKGGAGAVGGAERDVAAEGVEQQVRQVMAETGASLQQLQQLHAALGVQAASAE